MKTTANIGQGSDIVVAASSAPAENMAAMQKKIKNLMVLPP
jgi:hypothetical protein